MLLKSALIPSPAPFLLKHTLFFLPLLVVLSSAALLLSYGLPKLYNCCFRGRRQGIFLDGEEGEEVEIEAPPPVYLPSQGLWSDFHAHCRSLMTEGAIIVLLDLIRTLCLMALLALSIVAAVQAEPPAKKGRNESYAEIMKKKKKHKKKKNRSILDQYSALEWAEFGVSIFYVSGPKCNRRSPNSSTTYSSASFSSLFVAPSFAVNSRTMSTCSSSSRLSSTPTVTSGRFSPTTSRRRM